MKKRIAPEKEEIKRIKNGTYDRRTASAKRIKTAIIGLGKITWAYEKDPLVMKRMNFPTHFSVLRKHPNFQLVAAQDVNVKARRLFLRQAKKFKQNPKIYRNWEEMIKKEKPDLLVVASNAESHFEICNGAINLGIKNILCEKPISYSLKESEKLVEKAKRNNCVLFVNYFRAFNSSHSRLIGKIKKGFLGRIQSFDVKYSRGIFNNGTHVIDLLIRIFGKIKFAKGFKNPTRGAKEADPTISALLQFKDGLAGYVHGLNNDFYNIFEMDILGELGRIKIINDKAELYLRQKAGLVKGHRSLKFKPKSDSISIKEGLYPVYENIYLSLKGEEKNKCSGQDALKSLQVVEEIIKSTKK